MADATEKEAQSRTAAIMTIADIRYRVLDERLVAVDSWRTVRRHGVEVKEWAPFSYTAVYVEAVDD